MHELVARTDRLASAAARRGPRVGLAVGILAGGEQHVLTYGSLDRVAARRVAPDTIFEIGSITKVFTALALAELADAGIVQLDQPLRECLPTSVRPPPAAGREITLADLATHTSGLRRAPRGILGYAVSRPSNPYAAFSLDELGRGLARTSLRREPGARVRYSNLGMGLLGLALAHRAGTTYERLVVDWICTPLGLGDTVVDVPAECLDRLALGHSWLGRPRSPFEIPALLGAGALRSTAADMVRFLAANLDPPDTPLGRAIALTHRERARSGRVGGFAVGLGWLMFARRGGRPVTHWHNGGTGRARSFVAFAAQTRTGVVVLSNSNRSVDRLALAILDAIGGRDVKRA